MPTNKPPKKKRSFAEMDDKYRPNIKPLLYQGVGSRLREFRESQTYSHSSTVFSNLAGLDPKVMSNIERGKSTPRNPCLINARQFQKLLQATLIPSLKVSELIWGTQEDKVNLIKLVCIAVLINDTEVNPFRDEELSTWIEKQEQKASEELISALNSAKETCKFFINSENYKRYELLQMEYSGRYEEISTLILKHLLLDSDYFGCFFEYLQNRSKFDVEEFQTLAEDFLLDKGRYSVFLQNKSYYPYFIVAFHKYWKRVQKEYIDFFEKTLFSKITEDKLKSSGLRAVSSKLFYEAITSSKFKDINKWLFIQSEYMDGDAAAASVRQQMSIWAMLNRANKEIFPSDEDIGL